MSSINPIDECYILSSGLKTDIRARYEEPHRFYHNTEHIGKIWQYYWWHTRNQSWNERIKLATIFHDVIYEVGSVNNELRSAQFMLSSMGMTYKDGSVFAEIHDTILATKDHTNPAYDSMYEWSLMFLDLDLYELGSELDVFKANTVKVTAELATKYSAEEIITGRQAWLEKMLSSKRIFRYFKERESKARLNLEHELKELTA